eukprot:gb/GECG01012263.1/.p1 GENE.gb/GECG01012263.1/~~gb/GECG01012263.1/.p1  ORF type:complete len:298 (+),score=16.24 gb/GECG01012263.1/:1-894(+)
MLCRGLIGFGISGVTAFIANWNQALQPTAALAAVVLGTVSMLADVRFGMMLLTFFFCGTAATKYADSRLGRVRKTSRSISQVLCTGLVPTILAALFLVRRLKDTGPDPWEVDFENDFYRSALAMAALGYYACDLGDTLSSELGQFSIIPPVLVTRPWKPVPRGTNGGISLRGSVFALVGGLVIGWAFCIADLIAKLSYSTWHQIDWPETVAAASILITFCKVAVFSGIFGSFVDSLLGATLQATWTNMVTMEVVDKEEDNAKRISGSDVLSNEAVNFVSCSITMFVSVWLASRELTG